MTRSSLRPMASVGLVAAVLIYVGCSKSPNGPSFPAEIPPVKQSLTDQNVPPDLSTPVVADEKAKLPKVLQDFKDKWPAGILVISGEQDGYPDPCGCTEGQLGGLGRRYDLIQKIESLGMAAAKVDLGNLIHYRGNSRGGLAQENIKFGMIHKALGDMTYDAVALGPEDLRPGVLETLGTFLNFKEPKFLAANVKAADKELGEAIQATKYANAGPLTLGITAVLDPASYQTLQDPNAALLTVSPPDEILAGVLEEIKKKAIISVLMVQGPPTEARRLAEKFPGFDVVVGTSEFTDPDEHAEFINGGKTLLINNIGKKGKYVGMVGFYPDGKDRMIYRRVALDKEFRQAEPMRVRFDQEYQEMLKAEGVVEQFVRSSNSQSPGSSYAGAQTCQACHPKTFEKWVSTKHAKAYEPLTNPRRNREYDAECISCHTTGFGYLTGWVSTEKTPLLKGNQCENCHGPASLHVAQPDNPAYRRPMAMTAESAKSTAFCTKCHDEDNAPHFNFDTYYAQIFHKGLDTYDDPKVHQAQLPKGDVGGR